MKILLLAALLAVKTATATINESAQITSGNSVSAYLVNGSVVVSDSHARAKPLLTISFDTQAAWYLVRKVTWDKRHRQLTIDF